MSYDLFFQPRSGTKIDKRSFAAYFKSRRHYTVGDGQALYQNDDTGVYFIFDEPEGGAVAFNLNYFRPHTFGLEAAVELDAFAKAFDATAADDDEWDFTKERFLKAWNEGNRFAYRSMVADMKPVHTWPSKRIREVWHWNYARPPEEELDTATVFVPGIFAVKGDGDEPWSIAIWPPDCPILLPAVDAVLVPVAQGGKSADDLALVTWDEIAPVVKPYQEKAAGLARYRLEMNPSDEWPADVTAFLNKTRKAVGKLTGVPLDEILDRELIEEAGRR
jgi:hypothetical protein